MENFENTQSPEQSQPQHEVQNGEFFLKLYGLGIKDLNEIRRWTKFFAILGFILIGFFAVFMLIMTAGISFLGAASELEGFGAAGSIGMILLMAVFIVLYLFPAIYLWKFSVHARIALSTKNDEEFNESVFFLRKYFRFIGIMVIAVMSLYLLLIPITIITAGFTALG